MEYTHIILQKKNMKAIGKKVNDMEKESTIMLEEVAMKASMIYMNFSLYTKFIFCQLGKRIEEWFWNRLFLKQIQI